MIKFLKVIYTKTLILIMMLLLVTISSHFTSTSALFLTSSWSVTQSDPTYASLYRSEVQISIPSNTNSVVLDIPTTEYHLASYNGGSGTVYSYIEFYDDSSVLLLQMNFTDFWGSYIGGIYDLDLTATDFAQYDLYDTTLIKVSIIERFYAVPSNYSTYLNDNLDVTIYDETPSYRDHYFVYDTSSYYNSGNAQYGMIQSSFHDIPKGTTTITIDFSSVPDIIEYYDSGTQVYYSRIRLFDESGLSSIDTFNLIDYTQIDTETKTATFVIPYDTYDANDIAFYKIYLFTPHFTRYFLDQYNRNIEVTFNAHLTNINYYSQGSFIETNSIVYGSIPSEPTAPTPPTGFEFVGWYTSQNDLYTFNSTIPDDLISRQEVNLYARYRAVTASDEYNTVDPTPTDTHLYNVLVGFGFGNDEGLSMFYGVVVIVLAIIFIGLGASFFSLFIVLIVVTGLFVYLGLLPVWVSALAFAVLVLGALSTSLGGDTA